MSAVIDAVIRPALESDAVALADIYAHHVRTGAATFEIDPPDGAEMDRRRTAIIRLGMPYLVAEVSGVVAGYAYASQFRPRIGYRYTVEDSVYIRDGYEGRGLGRALLAALMARCEELGIRQVVAVVGDSANAASLRLHERFGFRRVGTLEKVGWKFERWFDAVILQKELGQSGS